MIGTVIQRQETPSSREFFFVHEGEVGKGSYLEYDKNGTVIARVAEVYKMNEYFENEEGVSELMRNQEDPNQKFPVDDWEVSIGKAVIMGKFSESGMIQRVSEPPAPGLELRKADPGRITKFLGLDRDGLMMGEVQQQDVSASFNMTETLQKHFAILAQSGAGKSYSASVLLEELLDRDYSPAIVAVDPHGDYTCFAEDEDYMNRTKVFGENQIQIAVKNLSAEKIDAYFDLSPAQRREMGKAFSQLNSMENSDYGLDELEHIIEQNEMNDGTKYVLKERIREMRSMGIFGKVDSPNANDIEPGKMNIIDLSDVINHRKKQIITAYFGQRFFRLRRDGTIPPFLYLLEEAHNFAPEGAPSPSKSVIEKIAREGRKFHAAIGLISQRPVKLSTTALSQCNTQFILRVTNPNDLEHIAQSSEGITSDVKNQIPGLKTGEAIVIGEAVNYPTFVDVRERRSKESGAGESLESTLKEWEEEQEQLDEDAEAFM
ncbi:MAG: ATP-binding protein [Candidatus Nanohaloarchaea archaeon]